MIEIIYWVVGFQTNVKNVSDEGNDIHGKF